MSKIQRLSIHEIQKIAAGEVVDRPANVVKELIENSLDARATHIKICIRDGGKQLIRVIDNGCGMDHTDAKMCFEHHATSKISTLSDLDNIATYGFRGEALSSIASISRVTLISKELDAQCGIRLMLQDGNIIDESIVGTAAGTDISIEDIFYNIPARKKFLKTRETEWRHIVHLVHAYCLAYTSIHFELISEEQQVLNCPPAKDLHERVIQLWHYDVGARMMSIIDEINDNNINITGIISDQQYSQYDRSNIYVFVNSRWIKNNHLIKALIKGYSNSLQPGKFPAAVLAIAIKQSDIDVNVHPRKEEVKFLHPQIVDNLVTASIKKTFEHNLNSKIKPLPQPEIDCFFQEPLITKTQISPSRHTESNSPEIFIPQQAIKLDSQESIVPDGIELPSEPPFAQIATEGTSIKSIIPPEQKENSHNLTFISESRDPIQQATIIGQFNKTYIVLEHEQGLMLIDQHAAHERILFEQFAACFDDIATVKLLFPAIITLPTHDISLLECHKDLLARHGILAESFGQQQIIVSSTPVSLQHINMVDLIKQFVALIHEHEHIDEQELREKLIDDVRALMACHAAVKSGDNLSTLQMKTIIDDLAKTDNNVTCPHGRPTSWILASNEIEKRFKRDYKGKSKQDSL